MLETSTPTHRTCNIHMSLLAKFGQYNPTGQHLMNNVLDPQALTPRNSPVQRKMVLLDSHNKLQLILCLVTALRQFTSLEINMSQLGDCAAICICPCHVNPWTCGPSSGLTSQAYCVEYRAMQLDNSLSLNEIYIHAGNCLSPNTTHADCDHV